MQSQIEGLLIFEAHFLEKRTVGEDKVLLVLS
jgi:hypothetical protein